LAATYLGSWIVLMDLLIYSPVMITALFNPSTAVKVEGINYFADTLLFGGVILSLAAATRPAEESVAANQQHHRIFAAFSTLTSIWSKSARE
jgi:hypothetical protein